MYASFQTAKSMAFIFLDICLWILLHFSWLCANNTSHLSFIGSFFMSSASLPPRIAARSRSPSVDEAVGAALHHEMPDLKALTLPEILLSRAESGENVACSVSRTVSFICAPGESRMWGTASPFISRGLS